MRFCTKKHLSEVPYVAYHNMDMQNLDIEIGFPVCRMLPGKDGIQAGNIPAGRVVFCMYRGSYSDMEGLYGEMSQWITDNGYTPAETVYEYYYNDPTNFPESELLTMVAMTLA